MSFFDTAFVIDLLREQRRGIEVDNDTVITRNLRHFQKIPNLRVEDY